MISHVHWLYSVDIMKTLLTFRLSMIGRSRARGSVERKSVKSCSPSHLLTKIPWNILVVIRFPFDCRHTIKSILNSLKFSPLLPQSNRCRLRMLNPLTPSSHSLLCSFRPKLFSYPPATWLNEVRCSLFCWGWGLGGGGGVGLHEREKLGDLSEQSA